MRRGVWIAALVVSSPAAADDHVERFSFGGTVTLAKEHHVEGLLGAELRLRLQDTTWASLGFGIGTAGDLGPESEGQVDSSASEARAGIVHFLCEPDAVACGGFGGSAGYHHQRIEHEDPFGPTGFTEIRDLVFGELRAIGRLQRGGLAIEASLGLRAWLGVHAEHGEDGLSGGPVASLGAYLTF